MKPVLSNIRNIALGFFIASSIILVLVFLQIKKHPHKPPPRDDDTMMTSLSGIVKDYGANPSGDIDKIILMQNNRPVVLHFPPHLAQKVTRIALKNKMVYARVESDDHPGPGDELQYEMISVSSSDSSKTFDVHDMGPPAPGRGNEVEVKGNAIKLITNDRGDVNAFILSGKLIALPPHVRQTLLPLITNAHEIDVKGIERNAADGFLNIGGLDLVKPLEITIDTINYLVQ
jgi:hypothetical protein